AALVADHEKQPVAKTVVRALRLRARLEQARLDQEAFGKGGGERAADRIPGVGGVAERQLLPELLRNSATFEIGRRGVAGLVEAFPIEPLGGGDGFEQLLAPVVARAAPLSPRDRDAEPPGESLDGFGKLQPVDLAHEVDDVAARAAPEAVVQ